MLDLIFAGLFIPTCNPLPVLSSTVPPITTRLSGDCCPWARLPTTGDAGRSKDSGSGSKASVWDLFDSGEPGVPTDSGLLEGGERIAAME